MIKKIIQSILVILSVLFILPLILTFISSLMHPGEVLYRTASLPHEFGRPERLTMLPDTLSVRQYYKIFIEFPDYLAMFWNSVYYAVLITAGTNIIAVPLAFVFAKIKFLAGKQLFFLFIVIMLMPFQVTLLSNYIISAKLGLLGNSSAIIIPTVFAPAGVFLLRQSFLSVPDELIDATLLETNSAVNVIRFAVLPCARAGLIAMNILVFADCWNMVEKPSIFINELKNQPLSAALNGIINVSPEFSFAGAILFMIPVVVLYYLFKDQIIKGLENYKW